MYLYSADLPKKLHKEETRKYLELFKNNNDLNAREKLIMHNLRLVKSVLNSMSAPEIYVEDLFECGVIGLENAIDTFDMNLGHELSTYLFKCIKMEMIRYLTKFVKKEEDLISFECDPIYTESGDAVFLQDIITDDEIPQEKAMEKLITAEAILKVNKVLRKLDDRRRSIFEKYWGINGQQQKTYFELSDEYGVTYQRTQQICKSVMEKLKKEFADEKSI